MLQNWKSITAVGANRVLSRNGSFWQREYWDTFMRDTDQEKKAIRYIENNPVKAGLCGTPEQWAFSSARCRDEYRQLIIPETTTCTAQLSTSRVGRPALQFVDA